MIARGAEGASIAYRVRGEGPLSLLFIHGWAGSGGYWEELLAELDLGGMRAVTYDLRGHGESEKRATAFTYEALATDALAVADAAGARRFVIVGFSMGAKFAQHVACAHPDRVLGLILVGGCPACGIPFPEAIRRDWSRRAGDADRLKEVTAGYITRPVSEDVMDRWAASAATVSEAVLDESLRICTDVSFAGRLASIRVPTLVVGGVHDTIFSPDVLRGVQASIPGARLALVDSNHEIPIEAPRELAGLVSAFVAGLGASCGGDEGRRAGGWR